MKKDKLTILLLISAALTVLFDIAYIMFIILEYALVLSGALFMSTAFAAFSLSAIILNAAALVFAAVYFILRRRGTVIK
jgi:hypothetical protein